MIPGTGKSPGEGNGNSLQYSCLENPMDRGAWRATVHGVEKSRAGLMTEHTHNKRAIIVLSDQMVQGISREVSKKL